MRNLTNTRLAYIGFVMCVWCENIYRAQTEIKLGKKEEDESNFGIKK